MGAPDETRPRILLPFLLTEPSPRLVEAPAKIVILDQDKLRGAGILPPAEYEQELDWEFRTIKRPLLANAFGRKSVVPVPDGRLIAVTSALANEGKTFSSVNLALSIVREKNCSVTLVDGDITNPQLTGILEVSEEPGLIDLLHEDQLALDAVLCKTNIPDLTILPVGSSRTDAPELLDSRSMEVRMRQLAEISESNVVIFDTAPLLQTNDAMRITGLVGQVLIVVKADSTERQHVTDAIGLLDENQPVNCILNQIKYSRKDFGQYGYGYGNNYPNK